MELKLATEGKLRFKHIQLPSYLKPFLYVPSCSCFDQQWNRAIEKVTAENHKAFEESFFLDDLMNKNIKYLWKWKPQGAILLWRGKLKLANLWLWGLRICVWEVLSCLVGVVTAPDHLGYLRWPRPLAVYEETWVSLWVSTVKGYIAHRSHDFQNAWFCHPTVFAKPQWNNFRDPRLQRENLAKRKHLSELPSKDILCNHQST